MAKTVAPITMVMVLITIVTGAYKPTNITGGPHIVVLFYSLVLVPEANPRSLASAKQIRRPQFWMSVNCAASMLRKRAHAADTEHHVSIQVIGVFENAVYP